jgi:hypothetical protein
MSFTNPNDGQEAQSGNQQRSQQGHGSGEMGAVVASLQEDVADLREEVRGGEDSEEDETGAVTPDDVEEVEEEVEELRRRVERMSKTLVQLDVGVAELSEALQDQSMPPLTDGQEYERVTDDEPERGRDWY